MGSASITNPGLTPVPSTATFAFVASLSIFAACRTFVYTGYASSSVVETIGTLAFRIASSCGITAFIDELVHRTTTCGFMFLSRDASGSTRTPIRPLSPATSPTSRPAFAGSLSMPPTILKPGRCAICCTIADPIGPRPKCTTRMLGIAGNYSRDVGFARFRMRAFHAWRDGVRRVASAPLLVVLVWLATTLVSLPLTLAIRGDIVRSLGNGITADSVARGVNSEWMQEFDEHATGLGSTFRPTIVGFSAALDNLSAFVDNVPRPTAIAAAAGIYVLVWTFLTGGIL